MTTSPRPSPSAGSTARDLKLYITAALAFVYVGAWVGFGALRPQPAAATGAAPVPALPPTPAPREVGSAVWYGELAPAQRPGLSVPSGWQIADASAAAQPPPSAAPVVTRAAPSRPRKIRTRSS